jgi:hypothetical protein
MTKLSTQPRGKERTKREDPRGPQVPGIKAKPNPKWVTKGQMNNLGSKTPISGKAI